LDDKLPESKGCPKHHRVEPKRLSAVAHIELPKANLCLDTRLLCHKWRENDAVYDSKLDTVEHPLEEACLGTNLVVKRH
jgi:hypothetical protein